MANGAKTFSQNMTINIGAESVKADVQMTNKTDPNLPPPSVIYKVNQDDGLSVEVRTAIDKVLTDIQELYVLLGDPFGNFTIKGK